MNKKVTLVARLLLGLVFFVFGLNGFLNFIPPQPMPDGAMKMFSAYVESGYFLPLLAGTETVAGFLLLTGIAAPLALIMLAPLVVQIIFFHLYLTPGMSNMIVPMIVTALGLIAASAYWPIYRPLFSRGK